MKKIVVTGATSMIGASLIRACLAHGVETVFAVVRPGCTKLDRLPEDSRIVPIFCAVDRYDALPALIAGPCDVFYHFAWSLTGAGRNEDLTEQSKNVLYTLSAVRTAAELGCAKFVGAGSQAEYGRLDIERISPDSPVDPVQPYGIAKYAAGKMAMEQAARLDISCLWVRVFSVYGIHDKPTSMISSSLSQMLRGEPASFTPAEQLWDYLYSDDAGEAFYLIGERACGRKVYCLGSGEAHPLKHYIELMRRAAGPDAEALIGALPYSEGVLMHLCADISTLQADTGFFPITDFEEGILRTAAWLREMEP